MDKITIQDCIEMQEKKDFGVIINDGKIVGFYKETENRKALPPTKANRANQKNYIVIITRGKRVINEQNY